MSLLMAGEAGGATAVLPLHHPEDAAIMAALRPSPTPVYTATVSPGATSATLVPAMNAGNAAASGQGPYKRTLLNLNAGVYEGSFDIPGGNWIHLKGATDDPADTVIQGSEQSLGVLYSHGATYLEDLTLRAYTINGIHSPRYPWHINPGEVCIAANCIFDTLDAAPQTITGNLGTSGAVGSDGESGTTIIFYRCQFTQGFNVSDLDNLHGITPTDPPPAEPMTVVFLDCHFGGNGQLIFEGLGSADGRHDEVYVIDCRGVQSISGSNHTYSATLNRTDVYTNLDVPVFDAANVTRDHTTWPMPVGGLSAYWRGVYGL